MKAFIGDYKKATSIMIVVLFSMITAVVYAAAPSQVSICHKQGSNWTFQQVNESALGGHLGHGDFTYSGPEGEGQDVWCQENAPTDEPEPIPGCMDETASNYNLLATVDDGSCEYPEAPTIGVLVVLKNVFAEDGETDISDETSFSVTVGETTKPFSEMVAAVFSGLNPGSYTVNETEISGYSLVSISSSTPTVFAGATTTITINNKKIVSPEPEVEQCFDEVDNDGDELVDLADSDCAEFITPEDPQEEATSTPSQTENRKGGSRRGSPVVVNNLASAGAGEVLGASTCAPYLLGYMKLGAQNDTEDVKRLQVFLNKDLGLSIPVTGFFGPLTHDAVKKFQEKYATEILAPWVKAGFMSKPMPTGYVYKTTLWFINSKMCEGTTIEFPKLD